MATLSCLALGRPLLASSRSDVLTKSLIVRLKVEPLVWAAEKRQADRLRCQTPEGDLDRPGASRLLLERVASVTLPSTWKERRAGGDVCKFCRRLAKGVRLAVELKKLKFLEAAGDAAGPKSTLAVPFFNSRALHTRF